MALTTSYDRDVPHSDTDKARLELERGLSDEFRNRRRENDVLRRQKNHHDGEVRPAQRIG